MPIISTFLGIIIRMYSHSIDKNGMTITAENRRCDGDSRRALTLNSFQCQQDLQNELNSKHHTPHFHAQYQKDEAVFGLDGNLMEGGLPTKQTKFVVAWAALHRDELEAEWEMLRVDKEYFKIEGLR